MQAASQLDIQALQHQLNTRFFGIGDRLLYRPTVESTNTLAMQLGSTRLEDGIVVLTDNQTAGKGRLGRRWVDISGNNVLSSTLLRPLFPPYLLVFLASLAVVETISDVCAIPATIKWPNDILIGERKVAGILIETSYSASKNLLGVVGIGVNVNGPLQPIQAQISARSTVSSALAPTNLETECGHEVERERFIARLLWYLEKDYLVLQQEASRTFSREGSVLSPAARSLQTRWRSQLSTLGQTVQVRQGDVVISGYAEDVGEDGQLLLRRPSGELIHVTWGDIGYSAG